MDLKELREQYGEKVARMEALAEAAKKDSRGLTEEEGTEFDTLEADLKALKRNIERAEELAREQEERSRATTQPVHAGRSVQVTRNEGEDDNGKCVVWGSLGEQLLAVKRMTYSYLVRSKRHLAQLLACNFLTRTKGYYFISTFVIPDPYEVGMIEFRRIMGEEADSGS